MQTITDNQLEIASKKAEEYLQESNINLTDLGQTNINICDKFLTDVYKKWQNNEIEDLVAHEIGQTFEGEPIHHLMKTSVYPLCDIYHHLEKDDLDTIKFQKK